ncbi:hypothetical protein [Tateyamaria sp. syn59]|uniref:hypothetical protein n=1 Tax=Tateyamaria sp. syn59 TaxID=2576942 RepID=UPI0011BF44F7|nr:hypothetical protein [Tateyamaria sp. syn59]
MILKRWSVIAVLGIVGLALLVYVLGSDTAEVLSTGPVDPGVVPQGPDDSSDLVTAITAVAGAVTTLGAAIFGLLGKWTDYRKAQLEVAAKELELEQKRRAAEAE